MTKKEPFFLSAAFGQKLFFVLLCGIIFFLLFQITLLQHGRDQGIYSVVGRTILDGGVPYKDVWDFKPPGIYFVYALSRALFGKSMAAVRIFEACCFLSLVYAFFIFSRRRRRYSYNQM